MLKCHLLLQDLSKFSLKMKSAAPIPLDMLFYMLTAVYHCLPIKTGTTGSVLGSLVSRAVLAQSRFWIKFIK